MKNSYKNMLIETLENLEIQAASGSKCVSYDEGISLLIHSFMYHKKKSSNIFFIGNGGSSAIASHMTADFMKNGGMNTCNLYDPSVLTCMGNDFGYEYVFSKQLEFLAKEDDLLVAISSSGNSRNILNAIDTAIQKNVDVITFTGFKQNNKVRQLGNINVYVPSEKYGVVESIHNLVLQQVVDMIMDEERG